MVFTATIAYVAAFQVASFRRVERFPYNSTTFVTGNLRDVAEGFYDAITSNTSDTREKSLSQARDLALICLCFLAGAIFGARRPHRASGTTPSGSRSHSFWAFS
jgi:uncharacterized membrane protein YoaK (UPF0700 family)